MDRVLLIVPSATYRAPDFLAAARELGVAVTVASERRAAMATAMGERALTLRLSDPARAAEQIAERAQETPFAAIVGVDDQGVMAAALGAERLGLTHNPPAAVARTRDKAAMRRELAEAGVPQPRFALLACGADVTAVARVVGFPCVVKPLSLSGSRGVIRADDAEQARPDRRPRPRHSGGRSRAGRGATAAGELSARRGGGGRGAAARWLSGGAGGL